MNSNLKQNLIHIQEAIYDKCLFKIKNVTIESEGKEYGACKFHLNSLNIIFRIAKITPKKSGQFVTFWKREENGPIEPFNEIDKFDFYVINVRRKNQLGHFVIPKSKLIEKGIISTSKKEGKRGFRIYPPWDKVNNKMAEKTQTWQLKYYVEINECTNYDKVKSLYKKQRSK